MRGALLGLALWVGCATPEGVCPGAALTAEPGAAFALVSSDYASTSVALLDERGAPLTEAWIDSGSAPPGIVASLSGDVAVASVAVDPCVVAVIDRFGTDVISFLDHCAGAVVSQVDVGSSFRANPHDVLPLGGRRVLVSRHEPNPDPDADERERGDDLLIVDWREGRVVSRIALSSAALTQDGERLHARPSRMAWLGERVVIGLARSTTDFMVTGPGAVALLDPESGALEVIPLDGLAGCDEVDSGDATVLVTCGGPAFVDEDARRERAGLALLAEEGGVIRVRHTWRAAAHPALPAYNTWGIPVGADRAVVTAMGDLSRGIHDRVGVIDLATGHAEALLEAGSALVIGDGAWDPVAEMLLIPDAHEGTLRRFTGAGLDPLSRMEVDGCRGLPPREVRPIRN